MAINRITAPNSTPSSVNDWESSVNWLVAMLNGLNNPLRINNGYVFENALFNIGGVLYLSDSDTAITGTESDYVMLTPNGATASASYASSLSGVSWRADYNGYYDASENLYLFDELKAMLSGEITSSRSKIDGIYMADFFKYTSEYILKKFIANEYHGELLYDGLEAGDSELSIFPSGVTFSSLTYIKVKSFLTPYGGTLRIKFTLFGIRISSLWTIYGKIYKNGVAYGTERTISGSGEEPNENTFSEDLNFDIGDTIEFWGKTSHDSGFVASSISNMEVCCSATVYGEWT